MNFRGSSNGHLQTVKHLKNKTYKMKNFLYFLGFVIAVILIMTLMGLSLVLGNYINEQISSAWGIEGSIAFIAILYAIVFLIFRQTILKP
jgi:hypothetical protein